jgi:outer membrane protein
VLIRTLRYLTLVLSVSCSATAQAQPELKPQWELGAGFAAIDFPVYRGSSERRTFLLPVPYFAYRGEIFRKDNLEMDVSVNGSVPAKDAIARQGMPNLDPTLEIGPSLNVHFYYSEDKKVNFDMRMPLRGVLASDFKHVQPVGWLFQPQLDLDVRDIDHSGWNLGLVGGLIFSDHRYHQYFYDVAPQYATTTRSAYSSSGGYAGTQFIVALNKRHDGYWTGGFMKWDNLNGAVFADSPLVKSKEYFTIGFAVTWVLDKSDKMVEVNND